MISLLFLLVLIFLLSDGQSRVLAFVGCVVGNDGMNGPAGDEEELSSEGCSLPEVYYFDVLVDFSIPIVAGRQFLHDLCLSLGDDVDMLVLLALCDDPSISAE